MTTNVADADRDAAHGQNMIELRVRLGPPPERDVEYAIPTAKLKACKAALKAAGFRFETVLPQ